MTNDEKPKPQGQPGRPEDNPFIAFRRFADSQMSSLFNTVFTLPATIANYNNAHQAREQCLFGKADKRKCEKLVQMEAESAELQQEGRELFREGNMQAVLRNSDTMLRLEQKAEEIRNEILKEAVKNGDINPGYHEEVALVERVASQKGRDWGAEWDWDIPKPFDRGRSEPNAKTSAWDTIPGLQSEVQNLITVFNGTIRDDAPTSVEQRHNPSKTSTDTSGPREWSWQWSWQWPPPADQPRDNHDNYAPHALEANEQLSKIGVPWREAYEDLMRGGENRNQHYPQVEEPHDDPIYQYSHDHGDQHDEPPLLNVGHSFLNSQQQSERAAQVPLANPNSDPNHHDGARTEMDAYEHLAANHDTSSSSSSSIFPFLTTRHPSSTADTKPSVLSTLTSTERTVAPDGSITTKVLLKQRFADGREESSETVYTQQNQGGEEGSRCQLPRQNLGQAQALSSDENVPKSSRGTRRSWFWSS